jgi:hypothetical protein
MIYDISYYTKIWSNFVLNGRKHCDTGDKPFILYYTYMCCVTAITYYMCNDTQINYKAD